MKTHLVSRNQFVLCWWWPAMLYVWLEPGLGLKSNCSAEKQHRVVSQSTEKDRKEGEKMLTFWDERFECVKH